MQPLPIDPLLPQICQAIGSHLNVILTATPGAGKTTRLPPELLNVFKGKILVLQPRRMAAVSAASRVADERGWVLGREVGYQVRFDSKTSAGTRLNFVTDALALRRLVDDPELSDVELVVIDEFHERNLNQDLMLGALRELQELGRSVKILIMSATLDTSRLERFLPDVAVIDVPGKVFPLQVLYSEASTQVRIDHGFFDRVSEVVRRSVREGAGDILVFLPGVGEIMRLSERLGDCGREVQILHGSIPLNEQQKVLRGGGRPRVVLATNVAEASVTVDGVDCVIDCGLAKIMRMNTKTGFSQLHLERIAQFNARQRAGRAARQKEGVCIRMWTEFEESTQDIETAPEIARSDLSQALLLLGHLGVSDFGAFTWFDHPPGVLLRMAIKSLRWLGALDESNRLTELGSQLIRYPLPPRLGALMALGEKFGAKDLAARMVAILSERDMIDTAVTSRFECDLLLRLEYLTDYETGKARHLGRRAEGVMDVVRQLGGGRLGRVDEKLVRKLLLLSQRDRLCRRRGKTERALMVGGRGVRLDPDTQVKTSEFFVALDGIDFAGQPDTTINLACGLSKELVLEVLGDQVVVREDVYFDDEKEKFYARRGRFIDDLPIEEPSLTPIAPDQVGEQMVEILMGRWDWLVEKNEKLGHWMSRWNFFSERQPGLTFDKRQALEMAAFGKTSLAQVAEQDLVGFIETVMGRELSQTLNKMVPSHYLAPSGQSHRIDYSNGAYVDVRLQEMFGQKETPSIMNGALPLTFRLLGPNYRPVQVTSDLASFWKNTYAEVRRDLRIRYPKHSWPDDPLSAKPEAKGRKRHT